MLQFDWNPEKAQSNVKKHSITFDEASTVFSDRLSLTIHDPIHPEVEERFISMGTSCRNRVLTIVHTDQGDRIRIISARKATKKERFYYENQAE